MVKIGKNLIFWKLHKKYSLVIERLGNFLCELNEEYKKIQEEQDEFITAPAEVEEGVLECGKCGGNGPAEGFDCNGISLALDKVLLPISYSISNIYPNPFNPITTIKYGLPDYGEVKIIAYNISGRQVARLFNNYQSPGFYSIKWNASSFPSGLYFIRMTSNNFTDTRKVLLIK